MNKVILYIVALLASLASFSNYACVFNPESTVVKNINSNQLIIEHHSCDNNSLGRLGFISDIFKAHVLTSKGRIVIENSNHYVAIRPILISDDTQLVALYFSYPGASNVGNSIRIFNKDWKQIKILKSPVNEYQANNGKGIETEIMGFFKIDNDFYIENVRSIGG